MNLKCIIMLSKIDNKMKELEYLGLSQKEQQVYTALLQGGIMTATEIAEAASFKRPSVYVQLDSLKRKGLIAEIIQKKKRYFQSTHPKALIQITKEKIAELEKFQKKLPQLIETLATPRPNQKRSFASGQKSYRGVAGMRQLIHEVVNTNDDVYFLGSIKGIHVYFPPKLLEQIYKKPRRKKVKTDYLITDWATSAVEKFFLESGVFTKIRFLPPNMRVNGGFLIVNKKVVIGQYFPDIRLISIEEPTLAQVFILAFQTLWNELEGKNIPPVNPLP